MSPFLATCLLAVFISSPAAQVQEPWIPKEVLILQSTNNYKQALATAQQAATRLRVPLNLEDYKPNAQSGLTMSKDVCVANGFEYPAYVPRGRQEEKHAFVSIEYSNGYNGFAHGYYLVVAAVGETGSSVVRDASVLARR